MAESTTEQKTYESEYENSELYVTVKCNKCGNIGGFFPHRVVYLECECGNTDYGRPLTDWPKGLFGDHILVEASIWHLPSSLEIVQELFAERHKSKEEKGVDNGI